MSTIVARMYVHSFILIRYVIFHDVEIRSQLGAWAGDHIITYNCYRIIE